jgi:hypothetical protein
MCEHANVDGHNVIFCGARAKPRYCACGREAFALCDWKVSERKSGTCDKPLCSIHGKRVAPGKYLCPEHQRHYDSWKRRRGAPTQGNLFEEVA